MNLVAMLMLLRVLVAVVLAWPDHLFVRGYEPRGVWQRYGCGSDEGCYDFTYTLDPDNPEYCEEHGEPMIVPVVPYD
jgi:hypothetical protein